MTQSDIEMDAGKLDELKEQVQCALASKDLYEWVKLTNKGYKPNRFGESVCGEVQAFLEDDTFEGAFQILILISPPQHGKACEDNTTVLTTKGWKRHGDLVVGDYVYGIDGFPKLITHAQTSYLHDCVEVTLDSGDSFICAKEHEWVVECNRDRTVDGKRGQRQTEILEAQHIFDGYNAKSPAIKVTMPLQNKDLDLPIDPYLLGLWLGDGHSSGICITSHIDDFKEISERLIKRGHNVKIRNDSGNNKLICVGVTNRKRGSNYFLTALKENNLIQNKHIPSMYINASYEQRVELLKGLMDTDGSVTKDGCICEYSGINKTLVLQVYELVRSLGIKCSLRIGDAKLNGRIISKNYRIQFTPNKEQLIFELARKQNRINAKIKPDRNDKNLFFIKSVKECGQHSVKCITVDGGIYLVGNGFVPTHNSTNVTGSVPAWYKGRNKDADVMILSYGDDLAKKFGGMNLEKAYTWGSKVFGVTLAKQPCTPVDFSYFGHNGQIISMGLTSGITGKPAKCFIKGTMVTTEIGDIEISKLVTMENPPNVLSYNIKDGKREYKSIVATNTSNANRLVNIHSMYGNFLTSTPGHLIYCNSTNSYIRASDLLAKDSLLTVDGKSRHVLFTDIFDCDEEVYDIQVEDNQNFFANGILVHNCVIIDDPIKSQKEADSEVYRNDVWKGWQSNVKSRLAAKAKIIVILTRWHEDDLAGRIQVYEKIAGLEGIVKVIHYACECEDSEIDPLHREKGEFLSPELGKDKSWGYQMKTSMTNDPLQGGKRAWDALYQGRPSAESGNILSVAWLKFWKPKGMTLPPVKLRMSNGDIIEITAEDIPDVWDSEIQSWDCTFKDKTTSDYVCGGYWGRRMSNKYLIDVFHKVASFIDTIKAIEEMTRKHPKAHSKYIEDKANGTAIINSMRQKISGLIPVEANDDKVARFRAVTPEFEGGNVYLPHPHLFPWVMQYIKELLDFPNGKNDDYVDMTSQALNKLMYQSSDNQKVELPKGLWAYDMLIEKGFSQNQIRKGFMNGDIRLIAIPKKLKDSWLKGR